MLGGKVSEVYQYFLSVGPLQLIGVAGFLVYIVAFGLVQIGRLDGNGAHYSFYNVLAASLVATSLIAEFNLASALIQCSWILIGLIGISRHVLTKRSKPSSSVAPLAARDMT